jgi:hypothetical protein
MLYWDGVQIVGWDMTFPTLYAFISQWNAKGSKGLGCSLHLDRVISRNSSFAWAVLSSLLNSKLYFKAKTMNVAQSRQWVRIWKLSARCCLWDPCPRISFSHHSPSLPIPVPEVWTEVRGVGSLALCAGSLGSSSPPSEPHIGLSTLHTSALLGPGTAEEDQRGRGSSGSLNNQGRDLEEGLQRQSESPHLFIVQ